MTISTVTFYKKPTGFQSPPEPPSKTQCETVNPNKKDGANAINDYDEKCHPCIGRQLSPMFRLAPLVALLAHARWMTTAQVERLCFPGRAEAEARVRLGQLSKKDKQGNAALLSKHRWQPSDGVRAVWGLTEAGYSEAELLLDEGDDALRPPVAGREAGCCGGAGCPIGCRR